MTLIDRKKELSLFQDFLKSVTKPWLLAIYGLNGLGKTSLLTHFSDLVNTEYQVAFIDFSQKNLCEDYQSIIEVLAECLSPIFPSRKFTEFRARLREITEGQKIIAQNTIIARYNSIINTPKQNINVYLNQEKGREQLEEGREMARAWCQLLASAKKKPLLFLDHWEMLVEHGSMDFCPWMVEDILIKSHAQNPSLKVVLSSDHPPTADGFFGNVLKKNDYLLHVLEPMDREYALAMLTREGLTNGNLQEFIFERVGGNPLLLMLAVDLWREQPDMDWSGLQRELDEHAYLDWLLGRIRQSMADERSLTALSQGVVLKAWKLDMLKAICNRPDLTPDWYRGFISRSIVQDVWNRSGYKQFVRSVREIQLRQLWFQDAQQFHQLHGRALDWFEEKEGYSEVHEPSAG